jgi:DNA-directed RNA polymerase subunit beta'
MKKYRDVKLFDEEQQDQDVYMQEILEKRKLEAATVSDQGEEEDFTAEADDSDE